MKRDWLKRAAGLLAALILFTSIAPEPYILRVIFLGDVMLGRGIEQAANREQDWQPFKVLQPLTAGADILAANLESPLTDAPAVTQGYMLCASPNQGKALQAASFDLVTLANNHSQDCGQAGADQTHEVIQNLGMLSAGPLPEAVYMEQHGIRLAFLALDDISTPLDPALFASVISLARTRADRVIVSIHWGSEYQPAPSRRQQFLASELVSSGADAIIGHHPHVIQPVVVIYHDGSSTPVPVFFSLGNALFDQHGLPDTREGEAAILDFGPGKTLRFNLQKFTIDPIHGTISELIPENVR